MHWLTPLRPGSASWAYSAFCAGEGALAPTSGCLTNCAGNVLPVLGEPGTGKTGESAWVKRALGGFEAAEGGELGEEAAGRIC